MERRVEAVAVQRRLAHISAPLDVKDTLGRDLLAQDPAGRVHGVAHGAAHGVAHGAAHCASDAEHGARDAKPAAQGDAAVLVVDQPVAWRLAVVPLEEVRPFAAVVLPARLLHKVVLLVERGADVQPVHQGVDLRAAERAQVRLPVRHSSSRPKLARASTGVVVHVRVEAGGQAELPDLGALDLQLLRHSRARGGRRGAAPGQRPRKTAHASANRQHREQDGNLSDVCPCSPERSAVLRIGEHRLLRLLVCKQLRLLVACRHLLRLAPRLEWPI
mmetsp:Transcript_109782/g.328231  ORF Transcript_109782/g.328231 Transcript_109782/m.328231 type:complete len:274 (-) Transcript_109782:19-840(-)